MTKKSRLAKFPRKHMFFLNPYTDARFTRCPKCGNRTKIRKFPFAVHIDPKTLMMLNMSGPYCPSCDLIILHKDKVEALLTASFARRDPSIIGNDYLIMGTVERAHWLKASQGQGTHQELFDNLTVFKEVVNFEPEHYGWVPDEKESK